MGHAGAIVTGNAGSYASKRKALEAAGVTVVDTPSQIAAAVRQVSNPAAPDSPQANKESRVSAENLQALRPSVALAAALAPGILLSAMVAAIGYIAAPFVAKVVPIPNMVIALVVGIALNPLAARPAVQPGMNFCVKTLLRWAVALLGLRVGLGDIAALGLQTAALIVVSMAATVASGFVLARWYGRSAGFGALVGVGTAVCGASATLATSTVVPEYKGKAADIAFVVVAVNALATLAMLVYPPLCIVLGFDAQTTGVMLGGTIHDVAQVVGAGYAVSEPVGNTAVIVKLFRVFLLLPVVLGVGWYFTRKGIRHGEARVPVPVFAIVFLLLCILNSAMIGLRPGYRSMRPRKACWWKFRPGACCSPSARSASGPRSKRSSASAGGTSPPCWVPPQSSLRW